ncbi:MAG TPA: glucoamylase family protein [Verrucomicrobiae bacterium]|jgi:hypothetical protein|nr:glucoamylase family protein [Verrucomicrobiae bacterium]
MEPDRSALPQGAMLSRRRFLQQTLALSAALSVRVPALWRPEASGLSKSDTDLLDEICVSGFRYFWEAASPYTGLVKDRSRADGLDPRTVGSIAATGFGLTALCIAAENHYAERSKIEERVLTTLKYFHERALRERGFYYHFLDIHTGDRLWNAEVSSIDTALLLCGVLTCREYFADERIRRLADDIYHRVDFRWMLNGGDTLTHGWRPESGFIKWRWDLYAEHMMLYLLAIGSPTFGIPPQSWDAWKRPVYHFFGEDYISAEAPLFIHQYAHAWVDFRDRSDRFADYFQNSIKATRAHVKFCLDLARQFPKYSAQLWGITASDSARGYVVWGGPPAMGPIDGTVVPAAAAGSLPFLPSDCLAVLHNVRQNYAKRCWKRYGFVDAFNPHAAWTNPDVIGINVGISMLMAANMRSQFVWRTFMKAAEVGVAARSVGFKPAGRRSADVPAA